MTTRKKGFGAPIIIIVVATLVALGAWWYGSQGGTSSGTVSDDAVSSGTVSESTAGSGTGIDSIIAGVSASGDAEATQARSEDGTEGVGQINNSLDNQIIYAQ